MEIVSGNIVSGIDVQKLLSGDRRALAKAITLIESRVPSDIEKAQTLLEKLMPHTGGSMRIAITGVPGVGKSTFIENFGLFLTEKGSRLAVLAIDPSSPISGGSIMADKTRMEKLSQVSTVYVRPSPSSGVLGGVGQKTLETILLCEAAGFEYIFVETVGVGQSEYEAADLVDFFIFLALPNAGDEIQFIKKGILELADAIIINKCDGSNLDQAHRTFAQFQQALTMVRSNSAWQCQAIQSSALEKTNFDTIYNLIQDFKVFSHNSGLFKQKRLTQNKVWLDKIILEIFLTRLKNTKSYREKDLVLQNELYNNGKTIFAVAQSIVDEIL